MLRLGFMRRGRSMLPSAVETNAMARQECVGRICSGADELIHHLISVRSFGSFLRLSIPPPPELSMLSFILRCFVRIGHSKRWCLTRSWLNRTAKKSKKKNRKMRFLSLVFAMAPIAVLGSNNTMGRGSRGGRCCDRGIEDPTGACAIIGYNSYGCTDIDNSEGKGCDDLKNWSVGRDVIAFILGSEVTHTNPDTYDIEVGFIGCAE
ncbi:hypothetical protein OOU_Y34scaffold01083g1 [Pyricularia oryzae Y34]|nr:hypothetical protein OOU_Y34scaffold01083g1 [Pyricularia oryzae Y34]